MYANTFGTINILTCILLPFQISVTLNSKVCTYGATFNYYAAANETLSNIIHSTDQNIKALYQPLEFQIDAARTTVSILAPWLNLTIIIRKQNDYLSIVLRMPADLVDQSDGICQSGCPSHTRYNFARHIARKCSVDRADALFACSARAGLLNFFNHIDANVSLQLTYSCQFDVLNSNSYIPISLYKGIAKDFLALLNIGVHVLPEPNIKPQTTSIPLTSSRVVPIIESFPTVSTTNRTSSTSQQVMMTSSSSQLLITTTSIPVATGGFTDRIETVYSSASSTHYIRYTLILLLAFCLCINIL